MQKKLAAALLACSAASPAIAELSLLLQNLTDRRHAEFGAPANRAELERAAFFKVRLSM